MVWFTGNRNNRIVRLDPATGKLTTYRIPDATVRDPHTMVFDPKSGVAWFTAQQAGAVGRFDPATGQFRLWKTGDDTRPYLPLIHISEPTRLLSISYAVFCLKKKKPL